MDGFEVCRRLKQDERTRDVPIIFVSALHDVEDRVQGFEVGGVDFVSKPIEEAEVLARVKTHLQLRTMQLHLEELVAERTAELVQANEALRHLHFTFFISHFFFFFFLLFFLFYFFIYFLIFSFFIIVYFSHDWFQNILSIPTSYDFLFFLATFTS